MSSNKNIFARSTSFFTRFVTLVGGFSGFLFGMDTGVIAGALPLIKQQMTVADPVLAGRIVSILMIGAFVGALFSGVISHWKGRKVTIVISAVLFTVCGFLSAVAPTVLFLIVVRFFLGVALGVASFITPMYLAEISQREKRGGTIAVYQLMITIGILVAFISDALIAPTESWRLMLGAVVVPSVLLLSLVGFLPKSPRWLVLKGRFLEAKKVLNMILAPGEVREELKIIKASLEKKYYDDATSAQKRKVLQAFLCTVLLGVSLQFIQQWTGINAVLYYAPTIFKSTGFHGLNMQLWCAVVIGVVNVLTTLVAIKYIDRVGRRPILYFGLTIVFVSLLLLSWVMSHTTFSAGLSLFGIVVVAMYIFGFAISLGPIVWILCSEIFPLHYRDVGVMCTTAANWFFNFLLAGAFPWMILKFNISNVFFGFAIIAIIGLLITRFFVPETKNVSLEEIQSNLFSGRKLREIGLSNER